VHCADEIVGELLYGSKPPEFERFTGRIGRDEERRRFNSLLRNDSFARAEVNPLKVGAHPHHHFIREARGRVFREFDQVDGREGASQDGVGGRFRAHFVGRRGLDFLDNRIREIEFETPHVTLVAEDRDRHASVFRGIRADRRVAVTRR
jgi:hypothetical protein